MREVATHEWPQVLESAKANHQTVVALFTAVW